MTEYFTELSALVQKMVNESGNPHEFDASTWLKCWMSTPLPALGGETPEGHCNRPGGYARVRQLLLAAQSGAYL